MKDTLEQIRHTALKALRREKNDLVVKTERVDSMIAAFDGNYAPKDVRAGRKLSAKHRRAIKEGIAKSRREKAKNGK